MFGKRAAIIVGINEYKKQENEQNQLAPLMGAENDARELSNILSLYGGFNLEKDIHLLTGKDATQEAILEKMHDLFWNEDPYELILFYFSGHGILDGYDNGYLAPYDMLPNKPIVKGIKMSEINEIISDYSLLSTEQNKRCVCVILDCCHSGLTIQGNKDGGNESIDFVGHAYSGLMGEKQTEGIPEGRLILVSSGATQKSRERDECVHQTRTDPHYHGIFTSYILEALEGKESLDGKISFNTLRSYLHSRMKNEKQDMKLRVEGDASLLDLPLTIESDLQKNYVVMLKKNVVELKKREQDIISLFNCARSIRELRLSKQEDEEIKLSAEEVEKILIKNITEIEDWLTINCPNCREQIESLNKEDKQLYIRVCRLGSSLESIDKFASLTDLELCILDYLWNLKYNPDNSNENDFIRKCGSCYRASEQTKTSGGFKYTNSRARIPNPSRVGGNP